jgi:hypothetical protein
MQRPLNQNYKISPSREIQSAIPAQMLLKLIDVRTLHHRCEKLSSSSGIQSRGWMRSERVVLHTLCLGSHTPNLRATLSLFLVPWRASQLLSVVCGAAAGVSLRAQAPSKVVPQQMRAVWVKDSECESKAWSRAAANEC